MGAESNTRPQLFVHSRLGRTFHRPSIPPPPPPGVCRPVVGRQPATVKPHLPPSTLMGTTTKPTRGGAAILAGSSQLRVGPLDAGRPPPPPTGPGGLKEPDRNDPHPPPLKVGLWLRFYFVTPLTLDPPASLPSPQNTKIDEVFIGSCMTNIGHFRAAGKVLQTVKGGAALPTRLWICPPTRMDQYRPRGGG